MPMNLLALNDDCLSSVFSFLFSDCKLVDLCAKRPCDELEFSTLLVCKRFYRLARLSLFKTAKIDTADYDSTDEAIGGRFVRQLQLLGPFIRFVHILADLSDRRFLHPSHLLLLLKHLCKCPPTICLYFFDTNARDIKSFLTDPSNKGTLHMILSLQLHVKMEEIDIDLLEIVTKQFLSLEKFEIAAPFSEEEMGARAVRLTRDASGHFAPTSADAFFYAFFYDGIDSSSLSFLFAPFS